MKNLAFLLLAFLLTSNVHCLDLGTSVPAPQQQIVIFVYTNSQTPVSGIQVEIVQTKESKVTDAKGLAEFVVSPGDYTVRIYGLNGPGPTLFSKDFPVTVRKGETQKLSVFDCLECV